MFNKKTFIIGGLALSLVLGAGVAYANHNWNGYHWGSTTSPFTLELGDNVSSSWDGYLNTTSSDWSVSSVLDTIVVSGKTSSRKCGGTNGRVEVCSEKYGFNGWLGVAQIWITGGEHITKGTVRVNDSYFNTSTYNTPEWRNLVMCQEVGHTLGLDHQDEAFNNQNLGTCMDYTSDPESNQHPNQHDYDELASLYAHTDNINTVILSDGSGDGGGGPGKGGKGKNRGQDIDLSNPNAWGEVVRQDAQENNSLYRRNLGNGEELVTFVIWAQ